MKRLIAFAVTILTAAFMTACSVTGKNEGTKPNGLGSTFQAAVSVTIGDLDASGTIKRFGDGMWEIEFDSPNTLSGVKLAFGEDGVEASYKGLSFSVPQTALPVKAMMLNLISAVDSLAKNEELSHSLRSLSRALFSVTMRSSSGPEYWGGAFETTVTLCCFWGSSFVAGAFC